MLKIDFRIINELRCCQDDFDYYSHALTIAQDFDFDYSNQFDTTSRYFNKDSKKIAPIGFLGSGLLASPFLFIGILFDNIFETQQKIFDFKKLFYSFSSVFYLLFSFGLISKLFYKNIINFSIPLAFFGSGIIYYSLERYSMPHVYEVFTVTLVIYLSEKFYSSNNTSLYASLIPIAILLGFLVRWTNYFIVLIPIIVYYLSQNKTNKLLKEKYFYFFSLFSFGLFLMHTKLIYGIYTFSPFIVYGQEDLKNDLYQSVFNNFFETIYSFFQDFFIILFTQEFGLFWFAPTLFACLIVITFYFFKFNLSERIASLLILISFSQCFYIISIWKSTASSYGFRYIFSIIPLSLYFLLKLHKYFDLKIFKYYLNYFSIFSILSFLFFETTSGTQLSLTPVLNSFGVEKIYSQPKYLSGLINSLFEFSSYLKIFATSTLASFIIKLGVLIFGADYILSFISQYNINQIDDTINLIYKIVEIDSIIFTTMFFLSSIAVLVFLKLLSIKKVSS